MFSPESQFLFCGIPYITRAKITRFGSDTREDQWESTDQRFAIRGQTLTGSSKFIRLPGIWYYLHSRVSFVTKWRGTRCMKHFTMWLPQKPVEEHIFKYWCAGGYCYVVHKSTHTSSSGLMELFVCVPSRRRGEGGGPFAHFGVVVSEGVPLASPCLQGGKLICRLNGLVHTLWDCKFLALGISEDYPSVARTPRQSEPKRSTWLVGSYPGASLTQPRARAWYLPSCLLSVFSVSHTRFSQPRADTHTKKRPHSGYVFQNFSLPPFCWRALIPLSFPSLSCIVFSFLFCLNHVSHWCPTQTFLPPPFPFDSFLIHGYLHGAG